MSIGLTGKKIVCGGVQSPMIPESVASGNRVLNA